MRQIFHFFVSCIITLSTIALATLAQAETVNPLIQINTSKGVIKLELFADKAPISVDNFLKYVDEGFYADTIFHRVIPGFMIQGGGFTADMTQKPTKAPIKNEASNGISNNRGTIAMARTQAPHSATSQFYINVGHNHSLNYSSGNPGYAVFGRVTEGMDIVDSIVFSPTTTVGFHQDVPVEPITIQSVEVVKAATETASTATSSSTTATTTPSK